MDAQPHARTVAVTPQGHRRMRLFGMRLSAFDVERCVDHMLANPRRADQGVGLFVTPNIQHVAAMRHDAAFATAMQGAEIVVCDGFPVYRYARWRGHAVPGRITGRDVVDRLFAQPGRLDGHRLFFVVDSEETATRIARWGKAHAPSASLRTLVPPFGFEDDAAYGEDLARRVAEFGTTLLLMGVGAPRSEVFVDRHRASLPPCWALCVGQSFKIMLGMTAPPPRLLVALDLEWFWRILVEPRRMIRRYGVSGIGFLAAVIGDLRRSGSTTPPR